MPPEIFQYRRWVKETFKVPKEQSVGLSSSSDTGHADKRGMPQEIDLISTDDFPPLQTASSSSQKDRMSIENSEIKTLTSGGRTGTLYSSVGAGNTPKQLELPNTVKDSTNEREKSGSTSSPHDVSAKLAIENKETCPQGYSATQENEIKLKEAESKDLGNRDLESPNEDFFDEFVLDPYVSWGDICDDGLADDDEDDDDDNDNEHRNEIKEKYGKTESSFGNGGPSAWSSDDGANDSNKQPKRPTYLATGQLHFTSHDDKNGTGRRYSYNRRNRRARSPCEGIGEQHLANARHARQLIISSPEKPIINPEKWAKEETKHYVKDHKVFPFPTHYLLILF